MDALAEIEGLTAHHGRLAGTDAERRAARHLVGRLRDQGRDAGTEAISVHPNYALTHLIHAVLAIGGGLLATSIPLAGTLVVLATAVSAFGDLTGSFHIVRRITGRRASQNVVSREETGKPGTLVLVAHYDAARSGAVFKPRARARRERIGRALLRRPIGPFEPFFWSIMAVLICCALRLLGVGGTALQVAQFVPTIVLIVAAPLLADIALSDVVAGASDNASGVATVLRLADRYGERLDDFDVWVLFTGAQESLQLGMRAFLRRHRKTLDRSRTVFVCVDDVGGTGGIRYATKEGFVLAYAYHPDLVAMCDQIRAEDEADEHYYDAAPLNTRTATDAHRARVAGFPAISIGCAETPHYHSPTDTPENVDEDALERAYDFCSELVELVDERIGPRLEEPERQNGPPPQAAR
ncbi:MAG: hypothetical protein QOJ07_2085 [Thermoleophilaceae bacterium]|nr:hypothetical protein [Thermoleophilaceae bacterium]